MDRQKLDRSHAKALEVRHDGGAAQAPKRAPRSGGQVLALLRQSFDMRLVDDGVFPGRMRPALIAPGEGLVDHHPLRHAARIIAAVEREIAARAAGAISEMRIAPDQPPGELLGVRIDQELVRIEAKAALRLMGAVHAVPVKLARANVVEIAVPDVLAALRQGDALALTPALAVEQAELDLAGIGRKQRKIRPPAIPGGAEGVRRSRREPRASAREREKLQQAVERQG